MFNPVLRGWIRYYGAFRPSAMTPALRTLNWALATWAQRKYKRLRGHRTRSVHWLGRVARRDTTLFAHWMLPGLRPAAG